MRLGDFGGPRITELFKKSGYNLQEIWMTEKRIKIQHTNAIKIQTVATSTEPMT